MEREVSSVISLTVALIGMSAVILIVMCTVLLGNGFKEDVYEKASDMQASLQSVQLENLSGQTDLVMPTAAIYAIMAQEHDAINSLEAQVKVGKNTNAEKILLKTGPSGRWQDYNNKTSETFLYPEDLISGSLNGKSKIKINKTSYGTFDIIIEPL